MTWVWQFVLVSIKIGGGQSHCRCIEVAAHYSNLSQHQSCRTECGNKFPQKTVSMCYTEHVYHRCLHWGRERIVGEPCCRARIVDGRCTACLYTETIGSTNSNELCSQCSHSLARGCGWRPFAHVSNAGWAKVEERMQQRGLGLGEPALVVDGNAYHSPTVLSCSQVH